MDDRIVVNPSRKYLETQTPDNNHSKQAWEEFESGVRIGMIALGLELETHARLCEDFGGIALDELIKHTVAASLRATLQSVGTADEVHDVYEKLINAQGASASFGDLRYHETFESPVSQQPASGADAHDEPRSAQFHNPPPLRGDDALLQEDSDSSWGAPDEQLRLTIEEWE